MSRQIEIVESDAVGEAIESLKVRKIFENVYNANEVRYTHPDSFSSDIFVKLVPHEFFDEVVGHGNVREVIVKLEEMKERFRVRIASMCGFDYLDNTEYECFLVALRHLPDFAKVNGVLIVVLQLDFVERVIKCLEGYSNSFN